MSKREEVLQALFERLLVLRDVDVRRNEVTSNPSPATSARRTAFMTEVYTSVFLLFLL